MAHTMQEANCIENSNGNPPVGADHNITVKVEPEDNDDLPNTQPIQCKILEGVVAYVEVRTKADNRSSAIASEVESLGARTEKTFTDSVTHVIFKEGTRRTVNKARRHNIPLVSVLWVESCKQNGCRVSEKQFPANLPDDKYSPGVGRLRKMKSMQPREYEEDLQLSAERWHKRQQRRQELQERRRLLDEYTPTSGGRVLVADTQPRSPASLPFTLTPMVIPPSPESPIVKSASIVRKYRNSQEDSMVYPPLHKRLFGSQGSDQSCSTPTARPRKNGETSTPVSPDTSPSRTTTTTTTTSTDTTTNTTSTDTTTNTTSTDTTTNTTSNHARATSASSPATMKNGTSGSSRLQNSPRNQKRDVNAHTNGSSRRQSQGRSRQTRRQSIPATAEGNLAGQSSIPPHSQSGFAGDGSQGVNGETRDRPVSAIKRRSLPAREMRGAQNSGIERRELETCASPRLASSRVRDPGRRHSLQVPRLLVGAGGSKGNAESRSMQEKGNAESSRGMQEKGNVESSRGMQEPLQTATPSTCLGRCGEDLEEGSRLNGRSSGKPAGVATLQAHKDMTTPKLGSKTSARKRRSLLPELGGQAEDPSVTKSSGLSAKTHQSNGTRENGFPSHRTASPNAMGSSGAGRERPADSKATRVPQSGKADTGGRTQGSAAGLSQTGSQEAPACSQRKMRHLMMLQDSAPPSSFLLTPTHSSQNHVLDSLLDSPESSPRRGGEGGGRLGVVEQSRGEGFGRDKKRGGGNGKKRREEGRDHGGKNGKIDRRNGDQGRRGSQHSNVDASGEDSDDEMEPARKRGAKRSLSDSPLSGESAKDRQGQRDSKAQHLSSNSPDRASRPAATGHAGGKRPRYGFVLLSDSDLSQGSSEGSASRPPFEMPRIEMDDIIDRLATDDEDDHLPDISFSKRKTAPSPVLRVSSAMGNGHARGGLSGAFGGGHGRKSLGEHREEDGKGVESRDRDASEETREDQNAMRESEDHLFDSDGEGGGMEESVSTQHSLSSSQQDNLGASMSAVFGDSFSTSLVPHLAPSRRSIQEFSTRRRKLKSTARRNRRVNQRRTEPLSVITESETNRDSGSPVSKSQGEGARRGRGGKRTLEGVTSPPGDVSSDGATTPAKVQLRHALSFTREPESGTQASSLPALSQTRRLHPTLVMTSLHRQDQDVVRSVVKKLGGMEVVDTVRDTTTHVVVGDPRRTLNVLRGMARGCWILRQEWVLQSLEADRWLQEEDFELTERFPHAKEARQARQREEGRFRQDLFSHLGPILVLPRTQPPSRDLASLLRLCGAQVTRNASQAAVTVGSTEQPGRQVVTPVWVLDSIEMGQALPVENFLLRPDSVREGSPEF